MNSKTSISISITTGLLLVYVAIATLPVPFALVFTLFLLATGAFIWMVFVILKDKSNPVTKKFSDQFYLDKEN